MASVCTPWFNPADMCEEPSTVEACDGSSVDLAYPLGSTDADYALAACNILYARTCYRFPGTCTITIWPCIEGCCHRHPYPCSPCVRGSYIDLRAYGTNITNVTITEDGVELDSDQIRVQGSRIIRLDQLCFHRNNLGITDDIDPVGSFVETQLTFSWGQDPPIELRLAAEALARELKTACNGPNDCALSTRVQSISRQGVAFTLMDLQQMFATGKTGIPIVDYALDAHGKCSSDGIYDPFACVDGYKVV